MRDIWDLIYSVLFGTCLANLPTTSFAQDADAGNESYVDVGATVLLRPAYIGSDQTKTNVLPYLGLDNFYGIDLLGPNLKADVIDIGTGRGLGMGNWSLRAGPRLSFDFGRDSSDSPTLEGLDDIDTSAVAGGFVRATWSFIGIDLSAGQDIIGGHDGFVAEASIGTKYVSDGWYIQPVATLSWGDETYTQTVYGITPEQAQSSALNAFETSSGFHQASAGFIGGFELSKDWNVTALFTYREALGDYRDSPIILAEDGSNSGVFTSLSLSRRFGL